MSLSPARGQPGARLGGYEAGLAPGLLGPASERALDALIEIASTLLSASPLGDVGMDAEAAMDYLATRDEFMLLLESKVESELARASTGAEDAPFEELMVGLMTAVQSRLESTLLLMANS